MNPLKINDTTYEVTLPRGDKVEIGDRNALDFKPHLKLNRWDGESFIKVGLPTTAQSEPVIEGERVSWVEPDLEARFYPLGPTTVEGFTQNELGGFEFEVILKEKPPNNQIILEIETQGFKYHYQPPLTPEEIAEGAVRPDNVVGSYAVYHDSKGNMHASAQDAERYKCGKAFHIYRPKVIDANGDWVWGELNIDEPNGRLIITVDQGFLDRAVYPVSVDPTFGYTSIGASGYQSSTDRLVGYRVTGAVGTGTSISFYVKLGGYDDGPIVFALYKQSDDSFVKGTDTINSPTPNDWNTANFTGGDPALEAVDYLITHWGEEHSLAYDAAGSNLGYIKSLSYPDSWPDPSGMSVALQYYISCYCTYTEGGGATEKFGADTGAGADAKASGNPSAAVSGSETGSGADSLPARDIALPDSGAGVDAMVSLQTPAAKTASDTGAGVDACVSVQVPAAKTSSDNGSGVEAVPIHGAVLADVESGSGVEAFIARLLAAAETGYGAEASEIGGGGLLKHLFAGELGEGADGLIAKIEKPTKGGGMRLWT